MKKVDIDQFLARMEETGGKNCFVCHEVKPNWLPELQDFLEEMEIPVEGFAATTSDHAGVLFTVVNGRLRLADNMQCLNADAVTSIMRRFQEQEGKS